ncbi:hypothetical protein [Candidatus Coxiella mudrowiae]|uniref:hypothetical protein n=1 Tax=Candidatus Coxiella mudrowiae TaxID=2054173 RepID=UPI000C29272A|nr:hypothetical protein [Candidatus Coxiella mudrowiae]
MAPSIDVEEAYNWIMTVLKSLLLQSEDKFKLIQIQFFLIEHILKDEFQSYPSRGYLLKLFILYGIELASEISKNGQGWFEVDGKLIQNHLPDVELWLEEVVAVRL